MAGNKPLAVCFDFAGVLVDHRDLEPLPEMAALVKSLHADGCCLAVVTRFAARAVEQHLGGEVLRCFRRVLSAPAGGEEKLARIREFARECGIDELSGVTFIDDKPENLVAVAGSGVRVIGFRGSGKYDTAGGCSKAGIPFAATADELRDLLAV
ncbi:MAG TPA: hypothetical protein EYP63_07085 [Desulfotomaculum sp.]|nr:hypothetical protein [Desulfotomaculum sp.]